jgi:hypothetical protein
VPVGKPAYRKLADGVHGSAPDAGQLPVTSPGSWSQTLREAPVHKSKRDRLCPRHMLFGGMFRHETVPGCARGLHSGPHRAG